MLWVPTARLLIWQAAVRLLPVPVSATAPQLASATLFSVKLTLPVGFDPATVAVKVTAAPKGAGVPEVASVVVLVAGGVVTAGVHASISVMRE